MSRPFESAFSAISACPRQRRVNQAACALRLICIWQATCTFWPMTGRRASDWDSPADARNGQDRRETDRRAPRRRYDPGFAAILVNQLAPPETDYVEGYRAEPFPIRRGLMVNFRA